MYIYIFLVGGLEHEFYYSIQLGMSSSQLTFTQSFFQRGRSTTNQYIIHHIHIIILQFLKIFYNLPMLPGRLGNEDLWRTGLEGTVTDGRFMWGLTWEEW